MNVLVLNSGSSTLKFQLIATDLDRIKQNADERLCRGQAERIGGEAIITMQARNGPRQRFTASLSNISAALEYQHSGASTKQEPKKRFPRAAPAPAERSLLLTS
jgi:acetate kinase